jgi:hypothetical protein
MNDPGQMKMMPGLTLSEHLFAGFKGAGPKSSRITNVTLASNPFRISYCGKQIVLSRFNYFENLKYNHLTKVQNTQTKIRE